VRFGFLGAASFVYLRALIKVFNGACAVLAKLQIQIPLKYIGKIFAKFGAIYFFANQEP